MRLSDQIINSTANTTTTHNYVDQRYDDETVINVRIVGLIVLAAKREHPENIGIGTRQL